MNPDEFRAPGSEPEMPLFLLLLIVPLIEIALFIQVGGAIGVWPTIGIVILTAVTGAVMLRRQGLAALRGVQSRLLAGENPGRLLADGAMILVAGVLLLTPGFLTDTIGLLLLIPAVRRWLFDRFAARLTVVAVQSRPRPRPRPGAGQTVEGEYEVVRQPDDGAADGPGPARRVGGDRR